MAKNMTEKEDSMQAQPQPSQQPSQKPVVSLKPSSGAAQERSNAAVGASPNSDMPFELVKERSAAAGSSILLAVPHNDIQRQTQQLQELRLRCIADRISQHIMMRTDWDGQALKRDGRVLKSSGSLPPQKLTAHRKAEAKMWERFEKQQQKTEDEERQQQLYRDQQSLHHRQMLKRAVHESSSPSGVDKPRTNSPPPLPWRPSQAYTSQAYARPIGESFLSGKPFGTLHLPERYRKAISYPEVKNLASCGLPDWETKLAKLKEKQQRIAKRLTAEEESKKLMDALDCTKHNRVPGAPADAPHGDSTHSQASLHDWHQQLLEMRVAAGKRVLRAEADLKETQARIQALEVKMMCRSLRSKIGSVKKELPVPNPALIPPSNIAIKEGSTVASVEAVKRGGFEDCKDEAVAGQGVRRKRKLPLPPPLSYRLSAPYAGATKPRVITNPFEAQLAIENARSEYYSGGRKPAGEVKVICKEIGPEDSESGERSRIPSPQPDWSYVTPSPEQPTGSFTHEPRQTTARNTVQAVQATTPAYEPFLFAGGIDDEFGTERRKGWKQLPSQRLAKLKQGNAIEKGTKTCAKTVHEPQQAKKEEQGDASDIQTKGAFAMNGSGKKAEKPPRNADALQTYHGKVWRANSERSAQRLANCLEEGTQPSSSEKPLEEDKMMEEHTEMKIGHSEKEKKGPEQLIKATLPNTDTRSGTVPSKLDIAQSKLADAESKLKIAHLELQIYQFRREAAISMHESQHDQPKLISIEPRLAAEKRRGELVGRIAQGSVFFILTAVISWYGMSFLNRMLPLILFIPIGLFISVAAAAAGFSPLLLLPGPKKRDAQPRIDEMRVSPSFQLMEIACRKADRCIQINSNLLKRFEAFKSKYSEIFEVFESGYRQATPLTVIVVSHCTQVIGLIEYDHSVIITRWALLVDTMWRVKSLHRIIKANWKTMSDRTNQADTGKQPIQAKLEYERSSNFGKEKKLLSPNVETFNDVYGTRY